MSNLKANHTECSSFVINHCNNLNVITNSCVITLNVVIDLCCKIVL